MKKHDSTTALPASNEALSSDTTGVAALPAHCSLDTTKSKRHLIVDSAIALVAGLRPTGWFHERARTAEFDHHLLFSEGQLLQARMADSWYSRCRGLLGYPVLKSYQALVLKPCSAVHGFGLGHTIDVAFIDRQGNILRCAQLKPNAMIICWHAHAVVEMAEGALKHLDLKTGQRLTITWKVST